MFYSLSLLSRKGPLGTIWMAAYFFKKLKRGQIASTDISSTVDKIMPETQISHRVLAQLLLGIVKIFSKKVDFLYDECNEALNQLRKSLLVTEGNAQNHVSSRPRKGNRCSKEVKSAIDHIAMTMKEHSCEQEIETLLASYHEVSVPLPEHFELGSFDFGVLDERDIGGSHQHPTPLGEWQGNKTCRPSYLDECLTNVATDLSDYKSSCFTPLADILPSCTLDVDLSDVHHESSNFSNVQRSLEQFHPGGEIEKEVCLNGLKPLDYKIEKGHIPLKHQQPVPSVRDEILSVEEQRPITKISNLEEEIISSMMDVDFEPCEAHNSNNYASVQVSSVECHHGGDFKKQVCLSGSLPLFNVTEEIHIPLNNQQTELSVGDKNHSVEGRINLTETINLQGELTPENGNDNMVKRHADALPSVKQKPNNSGTASPKFMLATPAIKESSHVLRKRKKDNDKSIVLSNKFMRQSINDASDLVCKRRKLPYTDLDIWKFRRFSNPSQTFTDPLIPFSSPVQEKQWQKQLPKLSKKPVELIDSPNVKDGMPLESSNAKIDTKGLMLKQSKMLELSMQKLDEMPLYLLPKESADHINPTDKEDITPHINAEAETEALIRKLDRTCQIPSNSSDCRANSLINVNELFFRGDDIGEQANGWSTSTRAAAQYLHNRFLRLIEKKDAALSLTEILEGKTRAACARFVYETLTLKTYGCIDVRQDFPYGDVSVSATTVLESFQKVCM